jgi:hypothetical protein
MPKEDYLHCGNEPQEQSSPSDMGLLQVDPHTLSQIQEDKLFADMEDNWYGFWGSQAL